MPKTTPQAFFLLSLGVALLAGLLYTPGLPGTFLFDDIPNIVNNELVHMAQFSPGTVLEILAADQVSGSFRGLPMLSFALDYWRGGGVADPATFKITNIAIHVLTAFALAWFFRRLLRAANVSPDKVLWLAPALALAWAAHPLQVSSVLYVVQRLQTLGTLFLVLALIAYLHARQAQIEGRSGRGGLLATVMAWALAMGCKEDSALLPAYTLALELTVLRFAAVDARLAKRLRRGYALAVSMAVAAYLFWFLPHTWTSEPYPGRDFNSFERLLTEARVLCLYLWQILWPAPQHMSFHYDWIEPSRGVLQPWTTLASASAIAALLAVAWRVRHRQPLSALGVFLFFSAHFITSNVIGLELAYEHRNHFALIGAVLAVGSVLASASQRLHLRSSIQAAICAILLLTLSSATALRAYAWRDAISLAQANTLAAPTSPRAWIDLCDGYVQLGGGAVATNLRLDDAILACTAGAHADEASLNNLALLMVLKTVRGDISAQDWAGFQQRLNQVRMSWDNARAPLILVHYAGLGVGLDRTQVLAALQTLDQRYPLKPATLLTIANFLLDDWNAADQALPWYIKVVQALPPGDPFAWQKSAELRARGHADMADAIENAAEIRSHDKMDPASAPSASAG